jgi:glycosyltransferase involved in cell wall biosynthesis
MKVMVDARELAERPTGVGRYLLELLRQWRSRPAGETEIVLCGPTMSPEARALGFRALETGGSGGTAWEQLRLPAIVRSETPDVLFCPAYTAPFSTLVPIVVTIHDISFTAHPEWFSWREGLRRRTLTKWSARRASSVITVSAFSADEIVAAYGVSRSKVHVIHHGVAHLPTAPAGAREPLVLFAGSIFNRRHVPELMAAVGRLVPEVPGLRLAIAGVNRTQPRQDLSAEAAKLGIAAVVELADYADDRRLALLYSQARAFVFVSDYEGFGLTPLEALAAGVPPIVADTAVTRETCGAAAVYVPPGDVQALASAIRLVLTDEPTRARVLAAAPAVLAQYSWERAARETLQVLEQAVRR